MLDSSSPPWIRVFAASASDATNALWSLAARSRAAVRFLRGKKMADDHGVMDEIAAALQFPYYFGENWNALDECLADLSWLPGDAFVVCVLDADEALPRDDAGFTALIRLFARIAEEWCRSTQLRPAKPFHVVLQCEAIVESRLRARLSGIGVSIADARFSPSGS